MTYCSSPRRAAAGRAAPTGTRPSPPRRHVVRRQPWRRSARLGRRRRRADRSGGDGDRAMPHPSSTSDGARSNSGVTVAVAERQQQREPDRVAEHGDAGRAGVVTATPAPSAPSRRQLPTDRRAAPPTASRGRRRSTATPTMTTSAAAPNASDLRVTRRGARAFDDDSAELGDGQRDRHDHRPTGPGSTVRETVGDDDHRPVDEVEGVADPAEPAQRASAGDRRHRPARQQRTDDEQQRAGAVSGSRPRRSSSVPGVASDPQHDRGDQRTSGGGGQPAGARPARPLDAGRTRAPPRRRRRPSTRRPGCRCRSRCGRRRRRRRSARRTTPRRSPRRRRTRRGPGVGRARRAARRAAPIDEVELLLDRQAPEVQHGGRAAEQLGVRRVLGEEVPVGDVEAAGDDVAPASSPRGRPSAMRPTATTASVSSAGGSRRRARRRQNAGSENRPVVMISLRISIPISTPDRVKNSDTPR